MPTISLVSSNLLRTTPVVSTLEFQIVTTKTVLVDTKLLEKKQLINKLLFWNPLSFKLF